MNVHGRAPRVVSLAPSATATLHALGAADLLVGVTHHCEPGPEVDPAVVGGWPDPAVEAVAELEPDVVLTSDALQRETAEACRERGLDVTHTEPARLAEVFETVAAVGAAVGRGEDGAALADSLRARVERVRAAVPTAPAERPVVYAEEWSEPPMAAGNWVPEAVAAAGGRYPFLEAGERSQAVDRETVEAADPDHVVLHLCGHGERADPESVRERGWELQAAVHVLDDSLLNQPSPRLVDGIERLAELLHGVDLTEEGGEARPETVTEGNAGGE